MRKPTPDPHPERADFMLDISPERILWRQIDRFLESQWLHNEGGIHGAISGLSALVTTYKDDAFEKRAEEILNQNGFEERNLMLFTEIIRLIDSKGKWLREGPKEVEPGKEWREAFQ